MWGGSRSRFLWNADEKNKQCDRRCRETRDFSLHEENSIWPNSRGRRLLSCQGCSAWKDSRPNSFLPYLALGQFDSASRTCSVSLLHLSMMSCYDVYSYFRSWETAWGIFRNLPLCVTEIRGLVPFTNNISKFSKITNCVVIDNYTFPVLSVNENIKRLMKSWQRTYCAEICS